MAGQKHTVHCQEEAGNDMTICALPAQLAGGTATEVAVIKARGDVRVRSPFWTPACVADKWKYVLRRLH